MGFFSRAVSDRKAAQLTYDQIASLLDAGSEGFRYVAGVPVNHKTALQVSTVLACVKVLADGCATPGLEVFRYKSNGTRERAENIPEYRLLARRPNEWQTSFEWRRMMTVHAALAGAGLSIKVRWDVRQVSRYELRYRCWDDFGMVGEFTPDDIFILHGLQWDWVKSLDAVSLARSAIGLGMATEKSQAAMHENGMRPSGVYSVDGNLTPEQHDRLSGWIKSRSGPDRAGTPLIIDRAAKWISTSVSGVDARSRRSAADTACSRSWSATPTSRRPSPAPRRSSART
jgi:HK97 family phage portal protein